MIVKRSVKMDVDVFEVGDVIKFNFTDGERVQAKAMKETPDGMLFVTMDCLANVYPMFNNISGMDKDDITYTNSDLRKALSGKILACFPDEIRSRMVAVNAEGDMLRIPSEKEIFGENVYGRAEGKKIERWKPMKKRRNRIAFRGKENAWEWYWLMNRHKDYASYFASVGTTGFAYCSHAGRSLGVRPVFILSNNR